MDDLPFQEQSEHPPHLGEDGTTAARVDITPATLENFTDRARAIFELARTRAGSRGSSFASTRSLLVAFLATGKHTRSHKKASPWWLWDQLRAQHDALENAARGFYPATGLGLTLPPGAEIVESNQLSSDLAAVLADARRLGRNSDGTPEVGARHLLGALLAPRPGDPSNSDKMLVEAGVSLPRLRREFLAVLEVWGFGDDLAGWRTLLTSGAPENRALSGYTADDVAGDDLIGITREVEAMASLAAAWSIEPPLSIGLFGEWGSGKSFFMQKMKDRVRAIAAAARASTLSQRKFGYYKNVVQVEFNAWHYVEGSLWAGLVEHIFQNLRVFDTDSAEEIADRQRKLFEELRAAQTTHKEAKEQTDRLAAEQAQNEQRRRELVEQQHAAERRASDARDAAASKAEQKHAVTSRDVLREVYDSTEVRTHVARLLGLTETQLATPNEVRAAVNEATEGWKTLSDAWRIVTADRGAWKILLWVLAVPAVLALLGLALSRGDPGRIGVLIGSLGSAVSTVLGLAAGAVAAWKRFAPRLAPLLDKAREVRAVRDRLDARVEQAKRERDEEVVRLEAEAEGERQEAPTAEAEAKTKELEARKAADDAETARRKIEDIERQLDALRPERMIASFIQDRAGADDYRKHLGVPALIRRDFEKLSGLFRRQRKQEEAERDGLDTEGKPLPTRNDPAVVNRIILYVDDLDRCPPDKVVEVLRAIHLLLAFPLFVVVVAVDARWVRRALKDQFELMLSSSDESASEAPKPDKTSPATHRATTDDYLEKIFQVAFWLRPLGETGSKDLLLNLVPPSDPDDADERGEEANHAGADSQDVGSRGARPSSAPPPIHAPKPAWAPVTASPSTLAITEQERRYMADLAPVVGRSPRAVKRFLNCYRLIKAILEPEDLDRFAPGETNDLGTFRPTMLLLGAVSGTPQLATMILDSLDTTAAKAPAKWFAELQDTASAHADWKRVEPLLVPLLQTTELDGDGSWRQAAERVDRFAFTPIRKRST